MAKQQILFAADSDNLAIARRFRQTFSDRKIARHLMYADSWERETIMMLMNDHPEMTLYEAIALCIKYPADLEH